MVPPPQTDALQREIHGNPLKKWDDDWGTPHLWNPPCIYIKPSIGVVFTNFTKSRTGAPINHEIVSGNSSQTVTPVLSGPFQFDILRGLFIPKLG